MPSPRNTMTLRARPDMDPLAAARAAPARYHQAADSPSGRWMVGTSMGFGAAAGAGCAAGAVPVRSMRATGGVAQDATSKVAQRTGAKGRIVSFWIVRAADLGTPAFRECTRRAHARSAMVAASLFVGCR